VLFDTITVTLYIHDRHLTAVDSSAMGLVSFIGKIFRLVLVIVAIQVPIL
jgi:hypothetical protein